MTAMILDNISLRHRGRAGWRLRHVSATWSAGERIGIIGRNGSGKTTLARILCGLERPSAGKISRPRGAGRVMLVMQRPEEHFLEATVASEIRHYARQPLDDATLNGILGAVALSDAFAMRVPRSLSMGEQRAVSIACGLATQPHWLILDEPMAGLDARSRRMVVQTLGALSRARQMGIAIISHHPDDLLGWAERIWAMDQGQLSESAFAELPVPILEACLDPQTLSLYATLRRLERLQVSCSPRLYQRLTVPEIVALLEEGVAAFTREDPV